AGQAFNVTGLPNGKYFVRVEVNPTGVLHETDTSDNVMLRKVKIKGKPGNRRVVVPPWNGIDTEGSFFF
ncbi:MAG TPA: lysyl oxidase family protein, partial [Actinomycetota bacterium]|nr:lysyl oxidase family protein [Actinomycetota bacterium]